MTDDDSNNDALRRRILDSRVPFTDEIAADLKDYAVIFNNDGTSITLDLSLTPPEIRISFTRWLAMVVNGTDDPAQ